MAGRLFCVPIGVLAVAMLAPLVCAFFFQEKQALIGFLIAILFASFFAVAISLIFQNQILSSKSQGRGGVISQLILLWFLVPIFAAIPFVLGEGFHLVNAYFEAVSAITTTGASVIDHPDELMNSLLLWRAILQWLGGLATLTMVAVFLQPLKLVEMGEGAPLLLHRGSSSTTEEMQYIGLILLVPFVLLTLLGFLGLVTSGLSIFNALCMSLSLISTGGFISSERIVPGIDGNLVAVLLMLFGAVNFSLFSVTMRGSFRFHRGISEIILFLCLWLTVAILLGIIFHDKETIGWLESMAVGLFTSASLLSTTAILPLSEYEYSVPLPLLLLLPVLGGCCFSTTGGIKLARVILIARNSVRELERLIHPSRVDLVSSEIATAGMRSIWAFFGAFLFCLASGTILLSMVGVEFFPALTAVTAALTNAGPMLNHLDTDIVGAHSYRDIPWLGKCVLIYLMVAGRIEILLLLCLFLPMNWRT